MNDPTQQPHDRESIVPGKNRAIYLLVFLVAAAIYLAA